MQSKADIAAEHAGAGVDQQAASEVVLCHLILLLPEVDLPDAVPAPCCCCCIALFAAGNSQAGPGLVLCYPPLKGGLPHPTLVCRPPWTTRFQHMVMPQVESLYFFNVFLLSQ